MKLSTQRLYIVSTPIGNLDDITIRAMEVLKNSDIILCEDTKHSLKLLNHLKIKKKLISYHKFNEKKELEKIIKYLNEGKILSLISDAGTPLLSDPGRLLIQTCIKKNIQIVPIPGVSSITASMSVSGFKDQFLFYGFLPFSLEIDQAFIAAVLTVIGYSLNDTVVVFDRIREYMSIKVGDRMDVINRALNSTLSRTINTSLTTFFVLFVIFLFGGEIVRGFMFAIMTGVIVGTYSSLFIASPIMYDTTKNNDLNSSKK